jgi:hypothetical protein
MTIKHKVQIYQNLMALMKLTGTKIIKSDEINDLFETPIDLAEYVLELIKREHEGKKK